MSNQLGLIQRITRLYTFFSPIKKGKYRLALASLGLAGELPRQVVARTNDGRSLKFNFDNHFAHFIYFLGEYEPAITGIVRKLIEPGDVCLDIGANIGWYTTLLQTLVGNAGAVHSFEPVPPTFAILEENVRRNGNSQVVVMNKFALGEMEKDVTLHIFKGRADGHASISDFGETEFVEYPSRLETLDKYLEVNDIKSVKFAKIDIEGAELSMLKGAQRLFRQKVPPILEIEMARATTRAFGYLPDDIIRFIKGQAEFVFFAIDEEDATLREIDGFGPEEPGANVICFPAGHYQDLLSNLGVPK